VCYFKPTIITRQFDAVLTECVMCQVLPPRQLLMQLANGGPTHLKPAYRLDAHKKKRKEREAAKEKATKEKVTKPTANKPTKPAEELDGASEEYDIERQQPKVTSTVKDSKAIVVAMSVEDLQAKIDSAELPPELCIETSSISLIGNDNTDAESKVEEGEEGEEDEGEEIGEQGNEEEDDEEDNEGGDEDEDGFDDLESEENDEDEGELDSAIDGTPLAQLRFVWDRSMLDEDEHNNFCAKSTSCCCATFLCGDGRPCGGKCCGCENAYRTPVDVELTVVDLVLACLQVPIVCQSTKVTKDKDTCARIPYPMLTSTFTPSRRRSPPPPLQ
jgi:hypothetical protein